MPFLQNVHLNWLFRNICIFESYVDFFSSNFDVFFVVEWTVLRTFSSTFLCQQFPISFRNNVRFVLMLVASYWLKAVLV